MLTISPQASCQEVLQLLRSTNLIFLVQESPYSAYVTIRKRFRKDASNHSEILDQKAHHLRDVHENDCIKRELGNLKISSEAITKVNSTLKDNLEEATDECEALQNKVTNYEHVLENLHTKLKNAETEKTEKKTFEIRIEKLAAENKILRHERDDLKKEVNTLSVAQKSSKKEVKETLYRFEKTREELEAKVKSYQNFGGKRC